LHNETVFDVLKTSRIFFTFEVTELGLSNAMPTPRLLLFSHETTKEVAAMQNERVQEFQNEIIELKSLLVHLDKTVVDKDAKEFLLQTAENSLGDVERYLLPHGLKATHDTAEMWLRIVEFQLEVAEGELKYADAVLAKDGASVVIG